MKKLFLGLITLLLVVPMTVSAKEKVKVYIFEAGGCPFCEKQMEYLKGLDSYNKTFEVIQKESYVDHNTWAKGKDYDLAVKMSNMFKSKGYPNANSNSTPFVIISGDYAISGYNPNLEEVINSIYEQGDKDVVGCVISGKSDCEKSITKIEQIDDTNDNGDVATVSSSDDTKLVTTIFVATAILAVVYIIKSTLDTNKIVDAIRNK